VSLSVQSDLTIRKSFSTSGFGKRSGVKDEEGCVIFYPPSFTIQLNLEKDLGEGTTGHEPQALGTRAIGCFCNRSVYAKRAKKHFVGLLRLFYRLDRSKYTLHEGTFHSDRQRLPSLRKNPRVQGLIPSSRNLKTSGDLPFKRDSF